MLILEKLEENRLHPRVSEKLKNGRRTNVNIHRIMRIVWEMGRKRYWKEEAEIVDGIAVYVIVLLFRKDELYV